MSTISEGTKRAFAIFEALPSQVKVKGKLPEAVAEKIAKFLMLTDPTSYYYIQLESIPNLKDLPVVTVRGKNPNTKDPVVRKAYVQLDAKNHIKEVFLSNQLAGQAVSFHGTGFNDKTVDGLDLKAINYAISHPGPSKDQPGYNGPDLYRTVR